MAALRQLLNARAMVTGQQQERTTPSPTDEEQRRNERMMNYSNSPPAVPSKSQSMSKTSSPEQPRQLHSQVDNHHWQHPLERKTSDLNASYNRGNSFDQGSTFARPAIQRSQTETTTLTIDNADLDRNSSLYEDNESPALSPALNQHLALRPLNTKTLTQEQDQQSYNSPQKQRRRSRSATQDDYYGATQNAWDGYGSKTHKPRQSSLKGAEHMTSDPDHSNGVMQILRDRQGRNPQPDQNVRAIVIKDAPLPSQSPSLTHLQGRYEPKPMEMMSAKQGGARKEAHTFTNTTNSPTDSITSTVSHEHRGLKRQRSLDYTPHQLAHMDYSSLHLESFDHMPTISQESLIQQHDLPAPNLPLSERLRYIYPDKTHKDNAHRARVFFSSLPIEQYEECGDLLLDGFKDIMERLKQARQQKRKAARSMEEQIAKREEWGRRKRGVLEVELGRLKGAGIAVVKPVKKGKSKGSM